MLLRGLRLYLIFDRPKQRHQVMDQKMSKSKFSAPKTTLVPILSELTDLAIEYLIFCSGGLVISDRGWHYLMGSDNRSWPIFCALFIAFLSDQISSVLVIFENMRMSMGLKKSSNTWKGKFDGLLFSSEQTFENNWRRILPWISISTKNIFLLTSLTTLSKPLKTAF